jgi:hypothetical protein
VEERVLKGGGGRQGGGGMSRLDIPRAWETQVTMRLPMPNTLVLPAPRCVGFEYLW